MKVQDSVKISKQRKLLLVLPLLVIPFVTFAFWSLGGGKGTKTPAKNGELSGLNKNLPDAALKNDDGTDKLAYYEKAEADSLDLQKQMKGDPNLQTGLYGSDSSISTYQRPEMAPFSQGTFITPNSSTPYNSSYSGKRYADPNEAKVYQKLDQLNAALVTPTSVKSKENIYSSFSGSGQNTIATSDVDRLEAMMEANKTTGGDPEMAGLNSMLEKILDVQHPERVKDRLRQTSVKHQQSVYAVQAVGDYNKISLLTNEKKDTGKRLANDNAFYSLSEEEQEQEEDNTIEATVAESQTLVSGAVVKLRLQKEVFIAGKLVPAQTLVWGTATLTGERLIITLSSIRLKASILPVKLSIYDMDGLEGIYIPGAIARDVAKESSENAIKGVGINSLDPSLAVQAAGAGIETAKSLLTKKVKLVRVYLKAGYRVLLKNSGNDESK